MAVQGTIWLRIVNESQKIRSLLLIGILINGITVFYVGS